MSDPIRERVSRTAERIRQRHSACFGLTAPCKFDCLCWFEASDAEAERVMDLSDEVIRAEIIADGDDPDEVAQQGRRVIQRALAKHREAGNG